MFVAFGADDAALADSGLPNGMRQLVAALPLLKFDGMSEAARFAPLRIHLSGSLIPTAATRARLIGDVVTLPLVESVILRAVAGEVPDCNFLYR